MTPYKTSPLHPPRCRKRKRSSLDTRVNEPEVDSPSAVIQNGGGPGLRIIFGHCPFGGLESNQPCVQGNLLCRRDWLQLRRIAGSAWAILPIRAHGSHFHSHPNDGRRAIAAPVALNPGAVLGGVAEGAHSPTAELVRSSLARARRSAPKRRRRAQRKRVRPVEQACSDTIEETISSTDVAVAQRKRSRFYKGSSPCPILHITIFHSHDSSSHRTMHHECGTLSLSVLHSLRLKTVMSPVSPRLRLPCWTTWAKADTLEFVSEGRKIQDLPRTTETGR